MPRVRTDDVWLRVAFALALLQGAFVAVMAARPGLVGVVLWYVAPVLMALATAVMLGMALVRSWRRRDRPDGRQLMGFAALALVVVSLASFRTYPSTYDQLPSRVRFRLPLDGPVTVAWGGPTLAVNYHAVMPDQRWAFDLLVTVEGRTHRGRGARLDEYYAYERPVLAPADGVVLATHDGEADGPIGQWRMRRATGNHIVLQVAPGEFLFVAHLQPGSIAVRAGERVAAGQPLARVGNSGNSSEPHLHLHLQDTPRAYLGEGIPLYFHGFRMGSLTIDRGMPSGGRERSSRRWPGGFTGDVVEHIAGGYSEVQGAGFRVQGSVLVQGSFRVQGSGFGFLDAANPESRAAAGCASDPCDAGRCARAGDQSSGGSPPGAILTRRGSKRASGSTRSCCAAITASMSL